MTEKLNYEYMIVTDQQTGQPSILALGYRGSPEQRRKPIVTMRRFHPSAEEQKRLNTGETIAQILESYL